MNMKRTSELLILLTILFFIGCKKKDEPNNRKIRDANIELTLKVQDMYPIPEKTFQTTGPYYYTVSTDYDMKLPENDIRYKNMGPQIVSMKPGYKIYSESSQEYIKTSDEVDDSSLLELCFGSIDGPIVVKDYLFESKSAVMWQNNIRVLVPQGDNSAMRCKWKVSGEKYFAGCNQLKGDQTKVSIKTIEQEENFTYYSGSFEIKFSYVQTSRSVGETASATVIGNFKNLRLQGEKGDRNF
jgi:hypothetical protein